MKGRRHTISKGKERQCRETESELTAVRERGWEKSSHANMGRERRQQYDLKQVRRWLGQAAKKYIKQADKSVGKMLGKWGATA